MSTSFFRCTVLKETLENRGVLDQLRARIRAEVCSALDDQVGKTELNLFIALRITIEEKKSPTLFSIIRA